LAEKSTSSRSPEEDSTPTQMGQHFSAELNALFVARLTFPHAHADTPWRDGGWTRKQIVGHLLDSAANNRQRFVRAATEGLYTGPKYAQQAWVAAHGYAGQSWETLLRWWQAEQEILAAVVDQIPEQHLQASCTIGADEPVTLRFLIEDYLAHQRWHFTQLAPALHPPDAPANFQMQKSPALCRALLLALICLLPLFLCFLLRSRLLRNCLLRRSLLGC
jgi:hypothetical protein